MLKNKMFFSILLVLCSTFGMVSFSHSAEEARIYPDKTKQMITDTGFDIKQPNKADSITQEIVRSLYIDDGMTILRVPYYGQIGSAGPGEFSDHGKQLYAKVNRVIDMVLRVKPDVKIFASIRMADNIQDGATKTFPKWVMKDGVNYEKTQRTNGKDVDPDRYAVLMFDYLKYMHNLNYNIYALGVDNESKLPGKTQYEATIKLKKLLTESHIPIPLIVAPEDDKPSPDVLADFFRAAPTAKNHVDIVGSHIYCATRRQQYDQWKQLGQMAADSGKPFWQTELHWDTANNKWLPNFSNPLNSAEGALAVAFDFFDFGGSVFVWWSYTNPSIRKDNNIKHRIQPLFTKMMNGAQPLEMTPLTLTGQNLVPPDHGYERFHIRSFKKENDIIVWLLNVTDTPLPSYALNIDGKSISGEVSYYRWGDKNTETKGTVKPVNQNRIELDIAARSIYMIQIGGVYASTP